MSRNAIILVELDDEDIDGLPVGVGFRIDVVNKGDRLGSGFVRRLFLPQPAPGELPFTVHVENHTDFEVGVDTDVKYDANNPDWGPYDVRLTVRAPKPTDEPADNLEPIGLYNAALAVIGAHEILSKSQQRDDVMGAFNDLEAMIQHMKHVLVHTPEPEPADEGPKVH